MNNNTSMATVHQWRKRFRNKHLGLLLLRLAVGAIFLSHGTSKLESMEGTVRFFGGLGFGPFWAYLVAWTETIGGALMVLGVGTSIAGVALAITMGVVVFQVKWGRGFSESEYEMLLGIAALCVALAGPGRLSIARMMWRHDCGECADCNTAGHCRDCK